MVHPRRVLLSAVVALALLGAGATPSWAGGTGSTATTPPPEPPPCADGLADLTVPFGDPGAAAPEPLPDPLPAVAEDPLAAPGLLVADGAPPPPRLPVAAWLVADLDTGEVVGACNAHVPLAPASTLKVLTGLALSPGLADETVHTASEATGQVEGSRVGLVVGSQYTVADLLHGLWLGSGNDAAVALAELAGGEAEALATMRATAERLGATSTVPLTPHGLWTEGQVSTAHDLAVLGRAALDDPRQAGLAATVRYDFPGAGRVGDAGRATFEIQTSNRVLRNVPGATGLKSGWTRDSGGAYVATAERDGRRLVATVLRGQGRTWHHARDLLEWGYTVPDAASPVGVLASGEAASDDSAAIPRAAEEAARGGRDDGTGGTGGTDGGDDGDDGDEDAAARDPGAGARDDASAAPALTALGSGWAWWALWAVLLLVATAVALRRRPRAR